jgi:transmembrane sensor
VNPLDRSSSSGESAAAQWLGRRDRGLSPEEQDAYLQWLREDAAHGAEVAYLERSWKRLDALRQWHPAHSSQPNPDLLAPRHRRKWIGPSILAAAAVLTIAAVLWQSPVETSSSRGAVVIHPRPERMVLEDGSLVELNAGASVDVSFSPGIRNVRLIRGEAHFIVAKDVARPFVVSADKFAVRAVGTAFTVRLKEEAVSVLVTEGNVQLNELRSHGDVAATSHELSRLVAGQTAIIRTQGEGSHTPGVEVRDVTPAEIDQVMAWQTMRLEFNDLPLRDVVAEFNRYNTRKLLIENRATGDILVGGSFRADNVEPFVRLLDLGFSVSATQRGNDIVLQRRE